MVINRIADTEKTVKHTSTFKFYSGVEKSALVAAYKKSNDKEQFLFKHQIGRRDISRWNIKLASKLLLYDGKGRPALLSKFQLLEIRNEIMNKSTKGETIDKEGVEGMIQVKAEEYSLENGKLLTSKLSNVTLKKYSNTDYYSISNAQSKTLARLIAEADAMNAISTILMFHFMLKYVNNPALIINFDATQFAVHKNTEKKLQVVIPNVKIESNRAPSVLDPNAKDLGLYIKWFCIACAAGYLCPCKFLF
jgi:hypothetical protein